MTPRPPVQAGYGWQNPHPAPPRRILGVVRWVWLVFWLPLLPTALMTLTAPAFEAPIFDVPLPLLCLVLFALVNLGVGRASHSDVAPAVAVTLTTVAGFAIALFGPAAVALWQAQ